MRMYNTKEKSRYREIKEGLTVVTTKEIINGSLVIPKGTMGKIVYGKNQVEAGIWLFDDWKYRKCLNVESDYFKPTQFRGVVLTVKANGFAIYYRHDLHSEIKFTEDRLKGIPYLDLSNVKSYESSWYRDNERVPEYNLEDIIQNIEENFSEFVNKLESRPSTEDDTIDLEYVFTDDSIEKFLIEQDKILDKFMECTGIWYNFLGGSIEG